MGADRSAMQRAASRQARRLLLGGLGWTLLAGAAIWRLWAGAALDLRIRPGWEWVITCIGTMTQAEPGAGRFNERDAPVLYQHVVRAVAPGEQRGSLVLEEQWLVWDAVSGEKTVRLTHRSAVDARTGVHVDGSSAGQAFLFPRGVRPSAYEFRTGYLKGLTLSFEGHEALEGLETYRFGYEGAAEYSEAYAGGAGPAKIRLESGQQIKCRNDQFAIAVWVEPASGEVVKLREGCASGDYVYDTATDLPVRPIARWSGISAEDEMASRIAELQRRRRFDRWVFRDIPVVMIMAGLLVCAATSGRRSLLSRIQLGGAS